MYAPTRQELLEKTYGEYSKHDIKIVIGDTNAQVGREEFFRPVIGRESLHSTTNDNGEINDEDG